MLRDLTETFLASIGSMGLRPRPAYKQKVDDHFHMCYRVGSSFYRVSKSKGPLPGCSSHSLLVPLQGNEAEGMPGGTASFFSLDPIAATSN